MHRTTALRVSVATHHELRALAEVDGLTLDEEAQRLARSERQRRIGTSLASWEPAADDATWLDMAAREASGRNARG